MGLTEQGNYVASRSGHAAPRVRRWWHKRRLRCTNHPEALWSQSESACKEMQAVTDCMARLQLQLAVAHGGACPALRPIGAKVAKFISWGELQFAVLAQLDDVPKNTVRLDARSPGYSGMLPLNAGNIEPGTSDSQLLHCKT